MEPLIPVMTPAPGCRVQRFVGDRVRFVMRDREGRPPVQGWNARLRTNLGRAKTLRGEILQAHTEGLPLAGGSWRDLPMQEEGDHWSLELPLAEVGYFRAKGYLLDERGWQHWPDGPDVGISVHPDRYRTANVVYCAFPRMFGPSRAALIAQNADQAATLRPLDESGYTVIPPSGKLRDLTQQLPHIFGTLGCRILHLLPVHPTPTLYARFGRFGSPYAALDLTAIDPALIEFDRRTTGIDQFRELTYESHLRGGRVFLDIVINHTGWGSVLQENRPKWFLRGGDGAFVSPGAWGVTWEDLVEIKHEDVGLWDELSQMLLTWCRRGVDGFRCDAGYKVPVAAWQYIVARVRQEFPETLFLLEGLGGAWEATEALLTEGGMQWAYSELFQNYSAQQVATYLDHSFAQSERVGLLVHYSETHDNPRLAARGRAWSLLRNRLCALASVGGGFGFTCGVEWLAREKIDVHESNGLAWGAAENLVPELAKLNTLLADHPCFFDGAKVNRLSPADSPVYALRRESEEGEDTVLVLVNTDVDAPHAITLDWNSVQLARRSLGEGGSPKPNLSAEALAKAQVQRRASAVSSSKSRTRAGKSEEQSRDSAQEENPGNDKSWVDLLGQEGPEKKPAAGDLLSFQLGPGAAYCLAPSTQPMSLHGDAYRRARSQAAWALSAIGQLLPVEAVDGFDWRSLAKAVDESPYRFLAAVSRLASRTFSPSSQAHAPPVPALDFGLRISAFAKASADELDSFPQVVIWTLLDRQRIAPIPPGHWLLLQDSVPFRASLDCRDGESPQHVESISVREGHVACFPPRQVAANASLQLERYAETERHVEAAVRFLPASPRWPVVPSRSARRLPQPSDVVLLTNGRGGMARLCVDLGRVQSKYDCVLGANLHPTLPVDRHIFAKRIRVWVNADGFISPLDFQSLASIESGPPAVWNFVANAGDSRTVEIRMSAHMPDGRNATVFHFSRPSASQASGKQLPLQADVRLTVRIDIEDRNFHSETRRNGGADYHFSSHVGPLAAAPRRSGNPPAGIRTGFAFTPASDRQLRVFADSGLYHPQPEWSENIPHPIEQSRGQVGSGDAYSPGWFEMPLAKGAHATLVVTAETAELDAGEIEYSPPRVRASQSRTAFPEEDAFGQQLLRAARAFVVRRDGGKTVIAGYPWFLDWGRDTFICARGLLAAGLSEEVEQIVVTFARFEKDGTLPNTIFGPDASNRDTSDAPLWFGVVCEELAAHPGRLGFSSPLGPSSKRTLGDVLESIASNYQRGTPNGIRMDAASGLIWSPSHFTWMDTNYPAGTPREGYPVEIQALWIRLLRQLERFGGRKPRQDWGELANRAQASFEQLFWRENRGWYADVLSARPGQPAAQATIDDCLRSNCLIPVGLGLVSGERARRCVDAALRYLVVPGALRSLAPLPVTVPLPVYGSDGRLLNNPAAPYWGRYEGDEDTRRKPAYHNGTAWTWTFPICCEALARAWDFSPEAVAAARAYMGSVERLMAEGCLGQIPEIVDGDAPHTQRGCDAQAWGVTEVLRVWKWLNTAQAFGGARGD